MMKIRQLTLAAAMAAAFASAPAGVWACAAPDQAKPFNAGPIMVQPADGTTKWAGPFSEYVVDMNGVGLQICTDSFDGLGNPPPCFYDPVDPATPYTQQLNRGGEAFWFLADSVFDTVDATGAQALRAVIVMGVESAFLSDPPAPGFETQFQRLRTRIDVAKTGTYKVESPWGVRQYTITTLLPPGNGQNRSEISEPIDISFNPNASNAGLVSPFLIADNKGGLDPLVYIGDGLTPTTVTGSPCNTNYLQVTATDLNGQPIDIGGNVRDANGVLQRHVYRNTSFTVMGKLAPKSVVPLAVDAAYYTRNGSGVTVSVMAESSTSTSNGTSMTVNVGGVSATMARDAARPQFFYASVPFTVGPNNPLPVSVDVIAHDSVRPSIDGEALGVPISDFVTIESAVANCLAGSCTLRVVASSSDAGDAANGVPTPDLTLVHNNAPLFSGVYEAPVTAIPATVSVKSAKGGMATRPVTVRNQ